MPINDIPRKLLNQRQLAATLEGGKAGRTLAEPSAQSASAVDSQSTNAVMLGTALDALSAMFHGFVARDRELLDAGFEDLVGILEEWRDAVPKA